MSRALERQSPLEWKFIILLYKYVARDDVQEYDGQKEKKEKEKEEEEEEEGVEMIKRRVIQSVKSRGCYFRRNSRTSWQRNGLFRAVDFLLLGTNETRGEYHYKTPSHETGHSGVLLKY